MKAFYKVPEIESGFNIEACEDGWFSVVVPEASENLCTNPSFEYLSSSGWTDSSGTQPAFITALGGVPQSSSHGAGHLTVFDGYAYYDFPAILNEVYTASLDIAILKSDVGVDGVTVTLGYTSSVVVASKTVYSKKNAAVEYPPDISGTELVWQRVSVTFTSPLTANMRLRINVPAESEAFIDGVLIENKPYATTYFDGDSIGNLSGATNYYWRGEPHASKSVRTLDAANGGRIIKLSDLGFTLMGVLGLGSNVFTSANTPISTGGALYQKSIPQPREFVLVGVIMADSLTDLQRKKKNLIRYLSPYRSFIHQPITLKYQRIKNGYVQSRDIDISCVYVSGLEGALDNEFQERVSISFVQYDPRVYSSTVESMNSLYAGYNELADSGLLVHKDSVTGVWNGAGVSIGGGIQAIAVHPITGEIYLGGQFADLGGIANADGIAKYNPVTGVYSALGTGVAGGASVTCIAIDSAGNVYAGGTFTTIGGVAANRIAKWNGVVWAALGTGMNDTVWCLAVGVNGTTIYAGGDFTTVNGVTVRRFGIWSGTAWSTSDYYGSATLTDTINTIAVAKDGNVYIGGNFTARIQRILPTVDDMGILVAPNTEVKAMVVGDDGAVYFGGGFTTVNGITANYIAVWNGTGVFALGNGLNGSVNTLAIDFFGNLWVGGAFSSSGSIIFNAPLATWNGSTWLPVGIAWPAPYYAYSIGVTGYNEVYVGGDNLDGISMTSDTTICHATQPVYPIANLRYYNSTTPTIYMIQNTTTGQAIYFNGLVLMPGENITINFNPLKFSVVSDLRGDLRGFISSGSTASIALLPGENIINFFVSSEHMMCSMYWNNAFSSIDEATL